MLEQFEAWGVKFNPSPLADIVRQTTEAVDRGRRGIHLTGVNPEQIVKAQNDPLLRQAINESDVVNVDGILAVWGLRRRGCRTVHRVATPDVMTELLRHADAKQQKVYLLGAEEYVIVNAVSAIRERFPGLDIVGWHNGFFKDETPIVAEIARTEPDYLFIALPSPQKEKFILKYKRELNVGVFLGVGGAFDIWGGKCHRAPAIMQKLCLEWLWRICQNPKQNGIRVLKFYPAFFKLLLQR